MATSFTLEQVYWANPTSISQTWTFEWKVWDGPESAWALISNSAVVNADGMLAIPLTVSGLTPNIYYVRATNNCQSPALPRIQTINVT